MWGSGCVGVYRYVVHVQVEERGGEDRAVRYSVIDVTCFGGLAVVLSVAGAA